MQVKKIQICIVFKSPVFIRLKSIVRHLGTKYPNDQQLKQIDKVDCRTAPTGIAVKNGGEKWSRGKIFLFMK